VEEIEGTLSGIGGEMVLQRGGEGEGEGDVKVHASRRAGIWLSACDVLIAPSP
jgi:hypothetical protein